MIVQELLQKVRFTLSDVSRDRWSDERLISLINDCISQITRKTILFVETQYIKLVNNKVDYDISNIAVKILRIEYEKEPLAVLSHNDLDLKNSSWQEQTGSKIKAYILDKQKEGHFKLYPILNNTSVTLNNGNINYSGNYGIITGITYSEIPLVMSGIFGDISPVTADGYIKVFYIERHTKFTDIAQEIKISSVAEEMLQHYIVGMAFRDNQDTQSRALSKEELDMYEAQLEEYSFEKAKNFSQASYIVKYNAMG